MLARSLPGPPILRRLTVVGQLRRTPSSGKVSTADVGAGGCMKMIPMIWRLHRQRPLPTFRPPAGDRPRLRDLLAATALVAAATQSIPAADEMANRQESRQVPRLITLVGVDTPGDPGFTPPSAADSPTESSGPFDAVRGDLGEDDDLSASSRLRGRSRRRQATEQITPIDEALEKIPDPLKGTPRMSPEKTGQAADKVLAKMLPLRSDSWADWSAPLEPLHRCGEPRALPPCVPPPPCHPSMPPAPFDLVGVQGVPSCGPIYDGPCQPRTGTHDNAPRPHLHRLADRFFDAFYMWK